MVELKFIFIKANFVIASVDDVIDSVDVASDDMGALEVAVGEELCFG